MPTKTSISFGLVYIPVSLHTVIRNNDISFNQLHKEHKTRIRYKKVADGTETEVKASDVVKGYQYDDGKYVIFSDEDFEKIKTPKDKTIAIEQFVNISEIDPIYYEKSYYVIPETGADNAYALLVSAMEQEGKVGIAKTVLGTKETLVAIRAKNGTLVLSTMYFADEVQRDPVKLDARPVTDAEIGLAKMLVNNMSKPFDIAAYKDEYRQRIESAIQQKIQGKEIVAVMETKQETVADLMEALQASLRQMRPAKPADKPINIPVQTPPNFTGLQ